MKLEEYDYYEKYWRGDTPDAVFQDVPIWGNLDDLNNMTKFFQAGIKGKILDVGCGEGDWVFHLAKFPKVSSILGIDISKTAIKRCMRRSKEKKLLNKVKFIVSPVIDMPFENNFFDTLFALEVIEHVLDVQRMFNEFNRVVKRGGYLGISTVDFNLLKIIIIGLFFFEKYFDPLSPHIRFFTKKTLEKLLWENGFKVVDYKWTRSYFKIMPMGQMVLAQKIRNL